MFLNKDFADASLIILGGSGAIYNAASTIYSVPLDNGGTATNSAQDQSPNNSKQSSDFDTISTNLKYASMAVVSVVFGVESVISCASGGTFGGYGETSRNSFISLLQSLLYKGAGIKTFASDSSKKSLTGNTTGGVLGILCASVISELVDYELKQAFESGRGKLAENDKWIEYSGVSDAIGSILDVITSCASGNTVAACVYGAPGTAKALKTLLCYYYGYKTEKQSEDSYLIIGLDYIIPALEFASSVSGLHKALGHISRAMGEAVWAEFWKHGTWLSQACLITKGAKFINSFTKTVLPVISKGIYYAYDFTKEAAYSTYNTMGYIASGVQDTLSVSYNAVSNILSEIASSTYKITEDITYNVYNTAEAIISETSSSVSNFVYSTMPEYTEDAVRSYMNFIHNVSDPMPEHTEDVVRSYMNFIHNVSDHLYQATQAEHLYA